MQGTMTGKILEQPWSPGGLPPARSSPCASTRPSRHRKEIPIYEVILHCLPTHEVILSVLRPW
jgi:hypothetical protein